MKEFLRIALGDWTTVGALTESSRYVTAKVAEEVMPFCRFVIEYGAGSGVTTKAILKRLPKDGKLVAIEVKKEFLGVLRRINDRRLTIICGNVRDVVRERRETWALQADLVVSNIPFTRMSREAQEEIVMFTQEILAQNGTFLVYQNFPLGIVSRLKKHFQSISWKFEARNFPPYFFMVAQKRTDRVS